MDAEFSSDFYQLGDAYEFFIKVNRFANQDKATISFTDQLTLAEKKAKQTEKENDDIISVRQTNDSPESLAFNLTYFDNRYQSVGRILQKDQLIASILVRSPYKWHYEVNRFAKKMLDTVIDFDPVN